MTPSREDLLERLKAATGPDRSLDNALAWLATRMGHDVPCGERGIEGAPGWASSAKPYTASLAAALALVERVLGSDWYPCVYRCVTSSKYPHVLGWSAELNRYAPDRFIEVQGHTAPLALLIALLSALPSDSLGQEETGK